MPKSSKKRKNGKVKKYVPKPKGISKTRMKKIMDLIQQQRDLQKEVPEIKEEGTVHISEDFTKKLNIESPEKISENEVKLSEDFSSDVTDGENI